jgi:dTMP kinase
VEDIGMRDNPYSGKLIAIDGPNGVGKSTIIKAVENKLLLYGADVFVTKEPTDTDLGIFLRKFAEERNGLGLACLVAADRYEHLKNEIIPMLEQSKIVITDRYVLSSLILQGMDGVDSKFIMNINNEIIKPDLQVALFANEKVIQSRLGERKNLTRFEKDYHSRDELQYMDLGVKVLRELKIDVAYITNECDLDSNVDRIVSSIFGMLEGK